jgi:hypothetical protein
MKMRSLTRIMLLLLPVIFWYCSGRDSISGKVRLIPEKELVSVMTDLYLADGLLAYPLLRNQFNAKDSIENYIDIIEKHGFTKKQMDKTMKYYFNQDPKKLQKIYDQVLARLSAMQSALETETVPPELQGINLWNQKKKLSVPEAGAHDLLYFSIPVKDTGLYEISFTAIIYKDDKSLYPRTTTFFWHASETQEGVRNFWDNIDLIRDGTRHSYSVSRVFDDTTFTHICGWLFQCDVPPGSWVKHGAFSEISVRKIPRIIE